MNKYAPTKKERAAMERAYRERLRRLAAPGALVILQRAADGSVVRAERVPAPDKPKLRVIRESPASAEFDSWLASRKSDGGGRPDPERGDSFLRALDAFKARRARGEI